MNKNLLMILGGNASIRFLCMAYAQCLFIKLHASIHLVTTTNIWNIDAAFVQVV